MSWANSQPLCGCVAALNYLSYQTQSQLVCLPDLLACRPFPRMCLPAHPTFQWLPGTPCTLFPDFLALGVFMFCFIFSHSKGQEEKKSLIKVRWSAMKNTQAYAQGSFTDPEGCAGGPSANFGGLLHACLVTNSFIQVTTDCYSLPWHPQNTVRSTYIPELESDTYSDLISNHNFAILFSNVFRNSHNAWN